MPRRRGPDLLSPEKSMRRVSIPGIMVVGVRVRALSGGAGERGRCGGGGAPRRSFGFFPGGVSGSSRHLPNAAWFTRRPSLRTYVTISTSWLVPAPRWGQARTSSRSQGTRARHLRACLLARRRDPRPGTSRHPQPQNVRGAVATMAHASGIRDARRTGVERPHAEPRFVGFWPAVAASLLQIAQ